MEELNVSINSYNKIRNNGAESVQNLAQMGFDVEQLTNLEQVNNVGQAFEQEFIPFQMVKVVVLSFQVGHAKHALLRRMVDLIVVQLKVWKAELVTPQMKRLRHLLMGHQQQVASLYGANRGTLQSHELLMLKVVHKVMILEER